MAVVLPHLLKIKQGSKREKLIQYAKRVWNLSGTDDELVAGAIEKTTHFYESLGLPTKATAYGINQETIQKIVARFEARGTNFGEKADITPQVVAEILEMSIA